MINAVVTIGFSQTVYSVPEEDGSGEGTMVEVCLDVFSGQVDRTVIVTMSAADGSAIGMYLLMWISNYIFIQKISNFKVVCISLTFASAMLSNMEFGQLSNQ